jgi:hypothetical protein
LVAFVWLVLNVELKQFRLLTVPSFLAINASSFFEIKSLFTYRLCVNISLLSWVNIDIFREREVGYVDFIFADMTSLTVGRPTPLAVLLLYELG